VRDVVAAWMDEQVERKKYPSVSALIDALVMEKTQPGDEKRLRLKLLKAKKVKIEEQIEEAKAEVQKEEHKE